MSFEVPPASKSKTEKKPSGVVVQIQGSSGLSHIGNKHKPSTEAGPIQITSKLSGDDGLVSYDDGVRASGVMTVATIKPAQKQASETQVTSTNSQVGTQPIFQQRPVLTKQRQKIISSQDRPKIFAPKNVTRQGALQQNHELLQRKTE